jgi:hypothetical protein
MIGNGVGISHQMKENQAVADFGSACEELVMRQSSFSPEVVDKSADQIMIAQKYIYIYTQKKAK